MRVRVRVRVCVCAPPQKGVTGLTAQKLSVMVLDAQMHVYLLVTLEIGCQAKVSKLKFIHLFYICIPEHVFNDSKWIQSVDFIDCKNPEP
ncbi:MAG: hypothetical protein ACRC7H_11770, partial [Plesiomonas shigelloides]